MKDGHDIFYDKLQTSCAIERCKRYLSSLDSKTYFLFHGFMLYMSHGVIVSKKKGEREKYGLLGMSVVENERVVTKEPKDNS